MSQIYITHPHSRTPDDLRDEIAKLANKLVGKYGGSYHQQQDNRVVYSNSGIEASISYDATCLTIEAKLGLMMAAFKGAIEAELKDYLNKNLNKN